MTTPAITTDATGSAPVGVQRFVRPAGHHCGASSTIYEAVSFGTGKLDEYGFWEHGCYECARAWERQYPGTGECWPHTPEQIANMNRSNGKDKP